MSGAHRPEAAKVEQPTPVEESENGVSGERPKKRPASVGVFPRMSLTKALELPEAVQAVGDGSPARRVSVFTKATQALR